MSEGSPALSYQLSIDEFAAAMVVASDAQVGRARATGIALFVIGVVVLAAVSSTLADLPFSTLAVTAVAITLIALGTIAVLASSRASRKRQARMLAKRTPQLVDAVSVTTDEHGIRYAGHRSNLWYAWTNYEWARDTPQGVLISATTTFRLVPSRAFGGRAEQSAWCEEVQRFIEAARATPARGA